MRTAPPSTQTISGRAGAAACAGSCAGVGVCTFGSTASVMGVRNIVSVFLRPRPPGHGPMVLGGRQDVEIAQPPDDDLYGQCELQHTEHRREHLQYEQHRSAHDLANE